MIFINGILIIKKSEFLEIIYQDKMPVFIHKYVHLKGFECWQTKSNKFLH